MRGEKPHVNIRCGDARDRRSVIPRATRFAAQDVCIATRFNHSTPVTWTAMNHTLASPPAWQEAIFDVLKAANVRQIAYVPDAGHLQVIRRAIADPEINDVVLTTEEEGVALVSGAWLGGQRAVLLMQSSGVGNCVNMFSLLRSAGFPFFTIVTMRGEYAEFNPWQGPMGRATQGVLELMGITVLRASEPDQVQELVSAGLEAAFEAGEQVAVLLGQNLIGRKKWERD
jgi:sulfopyruvate decarboxylase alpha subunit